MNFIMPIISIVATVWIFFGYIDPNYSSMKLKNAEKISYEQALASANESQNVKNEKVQIFNNLDPKDLDKLNIMLPDSIDSVRLIIEIDNLAKLENIVVKDIKAEAIETKNPSQNQGNANTVSPDVVFGKLKLQFSLVGTYPHFRSFLASLEKDLRVIDISSASVKQVKDNVYQFDLGVKTYWLK